MAHGRQEGTLSIDNQLPGAILEISPNTRRGFVVTTFVYDGDDNRMKAIVNGVTTAHVDDEFERAGSASTMAKVYYAGGQQMAMRVGGRTRHWLLTDYPSAALRASPGTTALTANSSNGGKHGKLPR